MKDIDPVALWVERKIIAILMTIVCWFIFLAVIPVRVMPEFFTVWDVNAYSQPYESLCVWSILSPLIIAIIASFRRAIISWRICPSRWWLLFLSVASAMILYAPPLTAVIDARKLDIGYVLANQIKLSMAISLFVAMAYTSAMMFFTWSRRMVIIGAAIWLLALCQFVALLIAPWEWPNSGCVYRDLDDVHGIGEHFVQGNYIPDFKQKAAWLSPEAAVRIYADYCRTNGFFEAEDPGINNALAFVDLDFDGVLELVADSLEAKTSFFSVFRINPTTMKIEEVQYESAVIECGAWTDWRGCELVTNRKYDLRSYILSYGGGSWSWNCEGIFIVGLNQCGSLHIHDVVRKEGAPLGVDDEWFSRYSVGGVSASEVEYTKYKKDFYSRLWNLHLNLMWVDSKLVNGRPIEDVEKLLKDSYYAFSYDGFDKTLVWGKCSDKMNGSNDE